MLQPFVLGFTQLFYCGYPQRKWKCYVFHRRSNQVVYFKCWWSLVQKILFTSCDWQIEIHMFVSFFCGSVWLMNVSLSMSSFRYKMLSQTTPLSGIVMHVNGSTQPVWCSMIVLGSLILIQITPVYFPASRIKCNLKWSCLFSVLLWLWIVSVIYRRIKHWYWLYSKSCVYKKDIRINCKWISIVNGDLK